jgi:cyclopropane fatty-acyl-phospholipid synthase-like methyltransferase
MPSCSPEVIPEIIQKVREIKPNTILEIGVGCGKWGLLCFEYLKFWHGVTPTIDGVEVFPEYKNPAYGIYRTVYYDDIINIENSIRIESYDLVLAIDVIEHIEKEKARNILNKAKRYLVSTPGYWNAQGAVFGNEHERHVCLWKDSDFINSTRVRDRLGRDHIIGWK